MIVIAQRKRTLEFTVTFYDVSGDATTLGSGDVVRMKIYRGGNKATPALDMNSSEATANGSTIQAANPSSVRLDGKDLDIDIGLYSVEFAIVDVSDSDAIKHVETGTFCVRASPAGAIGT